MNHKKKIGALFACLFAFSIAFAQDAHVSGFSLFSDYDDSGLQEIKAAHESGDTAKAEELYKSQEKVAKLGMPQAQYVVGACCENGWGTGKNDKTAFVWYKKSAEQGNAWSQCNLGKCYHNGYGTAQDYGQAFSWYKKSAEQGNAGGQNGLGVCYYNGRGTRQDYGQAFAWFKKAAEQGNAWAQYNFGYCYEGGKGTRQDYGQAFAWYKKSAEQGNEDAQNALGRCYWNGIGTAVNKTQARYWYEKTAAQQDNKSVETTLAYENTQKNYNTRKVRTSGGWKRFWSEVEDFLWRGYNSHAFFAGLDYPTRTWEGGSGTVGLCLGYEYISSWSTVTMFYVDIFDIIFDNFLFCAGLGLDLFDGLILCAIGGIGHGRGGNEGIADSTGVAWKAGGEVQWLIKDNIFLLRLGVSYGSFGIVVSAGGGFAF